MRFLTKVYFFIIHFIGKLFVTLAALLEFTLFVRLILKSLAANPNTIVVKILYQYTDILVKPFSGIFPNVPLGTLSVETATLTALIGYMIAAFIISALLALLSKS